MSRRRSSCSRDSGCCSTTGTGFRLLLDDWRGYVIALFALVGVANMYMSLFGRLRVDIKSERLEVAVKERQVTESEPQPESVSEPQPTPR
jgi:hypothetical protein